LVLAVLVGFTVSVAPARASETEKTGQQAGSPDAARSPDATKTWQETKPEEGYNAPPVKIPRLDDPPAALKDKVAEEKKKQSYAVGVETGRTWIHHKLALDPDMVAQGIKDALTGAKLIMEEDEILEAVYSLSGDWRTRDSIAKRLEGYDNRVAGQKFLAENKTKEGVVTLPDGLQYKIIKQGKGRKPTDENVVEINLRGTLVDGTEFVSTAGVPETFRVNDSLHLVVGLRNALKMMPVGSSWKIFVPDHQAFGWRPAGTMIGPYSTLIYEVELVAIK
jgi:FKBP-type peptidyl-prolyl cis-trans isomerase FklB